MAKNLFHGLWVFWFIFGLSVSNQIPKLNADMGILAATLWILLGILILWTMVYVLVAWLNGWWRDD